MGSNLIDSLRRNFSEAEHQIEELGQSDNDEEQRSRSQYQEKIDRLRTLGKRIVQQKGLNEA
jgi:hypothetical protein